MAEQSTYSPVISGNVSVTSVDVVNNRFIIRGKNLNAVTTAKIKGATSTNRTFNIESKSSSELVVFIPAMPSLNLLAEAIYELVISTDFLF